MNVLFRAILSVPVLFLMPGYSTWRVISARAPRADARSAGRFWFEMVLFSVIWTGWVGVLLAELGWFRLDRLLLIAFLYSAGLIGWAWAQRIRPEPPPALDRETVLLLVVVLISVVVFFHPHEFILGGADAGVYTNLGANIARTGAWLVHDPVVESLDPQLYPGLFREHPPGSVPQYILLPGFYLTNGAVGEIMPQFYPLHPAWMAIFYSIGGVRVELLATPLWGVLGCVGVFLVGQVSLRRRVGLIAALLLILTATQIWFSRYPTTEVLTQFLLFGGMYAFARYAEKPTAWSAILAGLALGQSTLVRPDLYFLVAIVPIWTGYLWLTRRLDKRILLFIVPFAVQVVHSLVFALTQSWPYFYNIYGASFSLVRRSWPMVVAGASVGSLAIVMIARWVGRHSEYRSRISPWWHRAKRFGAVVLVMLAFYGYFARPLFADPAASYYYWYGDHSIPYVEPYNLVRLGWYLSPIGIGLAVLGAALALSRDLTARSALLLGLGVFFSVLFVQNSRNNPHHIYVMRRYVPVVIPFFVLMAAYALSSWSGRSRGWGWATAVCTAALAVWIGLNARVVLPHVEHRGMIAQLETLTEAIGDSPTIVLISDEEVVGPGVTLGTPLRFMYGHSVFDLQEEPLDMSVLEAQVRRWQSQGWTVLFGSVDVFSESLLASWECVPVVDFAAEYPVLESSYEHAPRLIWTATTSLRICELANAGP